MGRTDAFLCSKETLSGDGLRFRWNGRRLPTYGLRHRFRRCCAERYNWAPVPTAVRYSSARCNAVGFAAWKARCNEARSGCCNLVMDDYWPGCRTAAIPNSRPPGAYSPCSLPDSLSVHCSRCEAFGRPDWIPSARQTSANRCCRRPDARSRQAMRIDAAMTVRLSPWDARWYCSRMSARLAATELRDAPPYSFRPSPAAAAQMECAADSPAADE